MELRHAPGVRRKVRGGFIYCFVWAIFLTSCFFDKVEATVRFKHVLPLCDPWCDPTQYWWCIPCTGVYAQTILTIGGCAPYQTTTHCGGAVSFFLFPCGQRD